MSRGTVVVIGGGLAGVTAALRCADSGFDVTLLEARPRLGGATFSFRRGDLTVDNGQHIILRGYTAYSAFLRRLGVLDGIEMQRRFRVPLLSPDGRSSVLRRWPLPAPAHLAPALMRHHALTVTQRIEAARTAMALRRLNPDDPALDDISFGAWLKERKVSDRGVEVLWGLLAIAALNTEPDQASLGLAARVFRTGMLDTAAGGDIGIPRRPLGELHDAVAHRALVDAGATVRLRSKARTVRKIGTRLQVAVHTGSGESIVDADGVVVAVPHQAAAPLLAELSLPAANSWSRLSASPIVNVHVHYDRPVMDEPMVAVIDSPLQWIFDRTAIAGAPAGSQYLAVSLSAARSYLNVRTEDLRDRFLPALRAVFPRAAQAEVLDFFVTREPRATFHQRPGTRSVRPRARTGIPGLVLAGAWTDTGLPDTIEGAVLSGEHAAGVLSLSSDLKPAPEVTP